MLLIEQNIRFAVEVADRWAVMALGEIDDQGDSDMPGATERIAEHLSF